MAELSSSERAVVERAAAEPMLDQVLGWAAVNSGSRNLAGLERMADLLVDAFAALPGLIRLERPATVKSVDNAGRAVEIEHGRHLHLTVRPTAPVQLLLTGHMDTVYGPDHAFQETRWIEDGVLNGPGVADMKGGLSTMLAALKAVEASRIADRIGYEVVINSDEEVARQLRRRYSQKQRGGSEPHSPTSPRHFPMEPLRERGREAAISISS